MTTRYRNGIQYSTDTGRLVCTAPTDPPISLFCKKRVPRYFEVCDDDIEALDINDAKLFVKIWFGEDSNVYQQEFESDRWSRPKQIDGRVYDPSRATLIGTSSDGETSLYRKRIGEHFLYNETTELIRPITYDDASDWTKSNLSRETWESAFGPIPDDDTRVSFSTYLRRDACRKLDRAVARTGKTKEQILHELIDTL